MARRANVTVGVQPIRGQSLPRLPPVNPMLTPRLARYHDRPHPLCTPPPGADPAAGAML